MMMMDDLQISAVTKMAHACFVIVTSSRKVKTLDKGQVDRREQAIIKRLVGKRS
jgi:hypothetical protein